MRTMSLLSEKINKQLSVFALLSLCAVIGCGSVHADPDPVHRVATSYDECVAEGGKILRSYPGQCVTSTGARFVDPKQAKDSPAFSDAVKALCVNQCGNGSCQEMVCMGEGCPCVETPMNCPADCR